MTETLEFEPGGYRYVPGVFQYSGGAGALRGFAIERARFTTPVPLAAGFERIAAHLAACGRPNTALCSCELRSPGQFTEEGFRAFNEVYVQTLGAWGIFKDGVNPVARSNVCPEINPPAEPSFHAFCYTVPSDSAPTFAISGSGEAPETKTSYHEHVVRAGDTTPDGLRAKADFVLSEMERRMSGFGAGWTDTTAAQVYTVYDLSAVMAEVERRKAALHGLTWHFARPPVISLDYEMDCRRILTEHVLAD